MFFGESERTKKLPEKERWVARLCAKYVSILLESEYEGKTQGQYINSIRICHDGRRISTVRRALEEKDLIVVSYDKNGSLKYIPEAIEKLLPKYAEKPVFEVEGYIDPQRSYRRDSNKYTHSRSAAKNIYELYRCMSSLSSSEAIYVYLHKDEYDIQTPKKTITGSAYFHRTFTDVKLFPKALIKHLNDTVLDVNALQYASQHVRDIFPSIVDHPVRGLQSKIHRSWLDDPAPECCCIPDDMEWTEKELTDRLQEALRLRRLLDRTSRELLEIRRRLRQTGGDEKFKELLCRKAAEVILEQAPLKINSGDDTEKAFARMFLSGEAKYQ
jgi:hypothetical protein